MSRKRTAWITAGATIVAVILCTQVAVSISQWRAIRERDQQVLQLKKQLPSYQARFVRATPADVRLAAEKEHAAWRGSGADQTYFFQERRLPGPWYCSGETVAIEVVVNELSTRVTAVRLGGRYLACL